MSAVYRLKNVIKERLLDEASFRLVVPSLEIKAGETIALVGHSGAGKSTLLDLLALISSPDSVDTFEFMPTSGRSTDVKKIWSRHKQNQLSRLRRQHIGYVLQTGGLLPYLSVRENIFLSRRLLAMDEDDTVETLAHVLGIRRQLDKLPALLSAGERQRVAFARALAHRPRIVLADEPTASLDPITARKIMAAVMDLVRDFGVTMIAASHDWAQVYHHDFRSLHQESVERDNGRLLESVFRD
jgi:putative ABC transport system ATP-binding protein